MKVKVSFSFLVFLLISVETFAQLDGKLFQMEVPGRSPVQIEFKDTRYVLHSPDQLIYVRGYIEIKADTITFSDLNGPMSCKAEIKGFYRFVYQKSELKFEVINDECVSRKGMASNIWKEIERKEE